MIDKNNLCAKIEGMKSIIPNLQTLILSLKSTTAHEAAKILSRKVLKISTAESCTGGLVSSRLTDVAGSSCFITANFVTYSNEAKRRFLNVSEETLEQYGAVSRECAEEMARGLLDLTGSDVVICTTGVAGPDYSEGKPVGTLFAACGYKNKIIVKEYNIKPVYSRKNMKFLFSQKALELVIETLTS